MQANVEPGGGSPRGGRPRQVIAQVEPRQIGIDQHAGIFERPVQGHVDQPAAQLVVQFVVIGDAGSAEVALAASVDEQLGSLDARCGDVNRQWRVARQSRSGVGKAHRGVDRMAAFDADAIDPGGPSLARFDIDVAAQGGEGSLRLKGRVEGEIQFESHCGDPEVNCSGDGRLDLYRKRIRDD